MNRRTDDEPIRGLPERLPEGERIVWQGAPAWKSLAQRLFRFRMLAVYFGILLVWRVASAIHAGGGLPEALSAAAGPIMLAAAAYAILAVLAVLIARTTVYTITNKRVAIRFGVALPMTINLPFSSISSADLKAYPGGAGDIALALTGDRKIGYLVLWPHVRPFKLRRPQPMLRSVPDAARVAEFLAEGLSKTLARQTAATDPTPETVPGTPAPAVRGAHALSAQPANSAPR